MDNWRPNPSRKSSLSTNSSLDHKDSEKKDGESSSEKGKFKSRFMSRFMAKRQDLDDTPPPP